MKKLVSVCLGWLCAACMGAANADSTYTQLDYVEAMGSQWVDTGIVGRYDTKAEIKAEWMTDQGDMTMLACRGNDGTADNPTRINFMNGFRWDAAGIFTMGWGYGTYQRPNVQTEGQWRDRGWLTDRVYTVVTEFATTEDGTTCSMKVDGTTVVNTQTNLLVSTDCNLAIFGNNISGTVIGLAKARCYGLKIWQKPVEGGEYALVRDFVPILQNGRAGFRDAVSGEFFFSATTTDLVAGTDANEPDLFVDYVESTGSQYVDLGVVGKSGVTMESKMSWVEVPGDGTYVAARKGANARFYLYHHYQTDTIGYGGYYQSGVVAQPGVVQEIRSVLKAGEQSLTVNGASRFARTDGATVDTGRNLYLFALNYDGAALYNAKARCYSLKLWEDDVLVRDFRPCLKRGTAALYDRVSGTIFYPGAGTLRAGRLPTAGKPDYFVEYVETHGDNVLDTGVRARTGTRAAGDYQLTSSRPLVTERDVYLEGVYHREERTLLGASDSNGKKRFYLAHMPNCSFWVGHDEWRCYPDTSFTVDEEGTVSEKRTSLGTSRHTFDVTLEAGRQAVVLDGREVCVSNVTGTVDAGGNLYMFACNRGGTTYYQSNVRVYSMKIWQTPSAGGDYVLLRDYRPCVKNGQAGLYDAVADEVVYPSFKIEEDRIGKPIYTDDMKPVEVLEYVDSNGSQWIDTGVTGRVDTVAEFKMAWLNSGADPDVGFLGSRLSSGDTRFYMWHDAHNLQSFAYGGFRYVNLNNPANPNYRDGSGHAAIVAGEPLQVKSSFLSASQTIVVDGVKVVDVANGGDLNTGYSMYLFAYNNYGTTVCRSAARLYEMKIWQDGWLVRHFLPVRLNCGLNVLYDTVEQKIYEPKGADFANWGPSIGAYKSNLNTIIVIR